MPCIKGINTILLSQWPITGLDFPWIYCISLLSTYSPWEYINPQCLKLIPKTEKPTKKLMNGNIQTMNGKQVTVIKYFGQIPNQQS